MGKKAIVTVQDLRDALASCNRGSRVVVGDYEVSTLVEGKGCVDIILGCKTEAAVEDKPKSKLDTILDGLDLNKGGRKA